MRKIVLPLLVALFPLATMAEEPFVAQNVDVTEWKAVFGRIEARDRVQARSRLGGTIISINVSEGSKVEKGQQIASITDEKLILQLNAIDATLTSLASQLDTASADLRRGEDLLKRGVATAQQLDQLRTRVDVITGQIGTAQAERSVLKQREAEGAVLSPIGGSVLQVPLTEGSVVMPGESIAEIGGGGFFLRLAVPERHASYLEEGAEIRIGSDEGETTGVLAKLYPQIENGRVIVDVEFAGMETDFVDARVLVRLPVGKSTALLVPASSVSTRMGLDFVTVQAADGTDTHRTVVAGGSRHMGDLEMIEILSGLTAGEQVVASHE
ncbi:efflux RND transporter periplasmic adaptor subunit [Aliiroseovarius sp. S1123]|uniref:efflux RND transporter periplasmic adaptor subunit n=1 Tax=unclassified Aliiroseovarius TaxID=2623558 RepID=UPI001FF22D91|nr:efflux RND transporter periplasmic adaptor subunit [Aliiroseovarius sp. S1123]MCK0171788.1 efflux RND transporter periplasmic adaptor subunit [Aliiroseovarius sp. S1123]